MIDGAPLEAKRRADAVLSYVVLSILIVGWAVLVITLPRATNRTLTFDVVCRSGNPVVGMWVESVSGGSYWGQAGEPGAAGFARFTYQHTFDGDYELRVGCGGSAQTWGVEARSTQGAWTYRRIVCDDIDFSPPAPARCRDELRG